MISFICDSSIKKLYKSKYTINNKINFYITLETYKIFFHIIKVYEFLKSETCKIYN